MKAIAVTDQAAGRRLITPLPNALAARRGHLACSCRNADRSRTESVVRSYPSEKRKYVQEMNLLRRGARRWRAPCVDACLKNMLASVTTPMQVYPIHADKRRMLGREQSFRAGRALSKPQETRIF